MSVTLLVVDDSGFFRNRICEILKDSSEIKVIGTANNGREAIDKARALKPAVISMDYEMPVMDGVTAVRLIMEEMPTPILMFSTLTYEGARVTLDALEAGAVDFLPKNFEDITRNSANLKQLLTQRILQVSTARQCDASASKSAPPSSPAVPAESSPNKATPIRTLGRAEPTSRQRKKPQRALSPAASSAGGSLKHKVDLVVIGASTGGPVAVAKILSNLPKDFSKPIVIIQHMPATFTPAFAERLNSISAITVRHAEDGMALRPGEALLAPGGKQLLFDNENRNLSVRVIDGDDRLTYKPSVDITFGSASRAFGGRTMAIVLTGMGADGREGARILKSQDALVWTQDKQSCVIYGMPAAVKSAGYSDRELPLNEFVPEMLRELN